VDTIPPSYLALYRQGAATCPGLPWTVLAGIGSIESDHGRSTAAGVHSGANSAGAQGPMQFLPATFAGYDHPVPADPAPTPPGAAHPPSPYNPVDAIYAAARYLWGLTPGSWTRGGITPPLGA
jgi:soluble lytic murein transglycosylase-like protein